MNIIQFADFKDLPHIANLEKLSMKNGWTLAQITEAYKNNTLFLTAEQGYLSFVPIPPECEINNICVNPDFQKQGLATNLINCLINYCRNNKINKIFLEVSSHNTKALNLYNKFNFTKAYVRKNYYGQNDDAIIMELLLNEINQSTTAAT